MSCQDGVTTAKAAGNESRETSKAGFPPHLLIFVDNIGFGANIYMLKTSQVIFNYMAQIHYKR